MDIGLPQEGEEVLVDEGSSRLLIDSKSTSTYTLYEVEETVMHPKPKVADKYSEKPYMFDALTGVMRIYRLVGVDEATDEGLERLLAQATIL